MISATRRWLRRNQNGIAVAAGVAGAAYLAGQYVVGKITEARERMAFDRLARENLRRRFEQNQTDCTFTVLALLPNVSENVLEALPVEQLTHELQQRKSNRLARSGGEGALSEPSSGPASTREGDSTSLSSLQSSSYVHASQLAHSDGDADRPRRSKAQLWDEIKISSITRAFTMLYTLSLLTLLTRIQLNLLGRLNYLSSVISLARPSPPEGANSISLEDHDGPGSPGGYGVGNDFETNRRYLAFTWYLLNKGYRIILCEVQAAVTEVFGPISPIEAITASQLSALTLQVRQRMEGATAEDRRCKNWLSYLLPAREEEENLLVQSGVLAEAAAAPSTTSSAPLPSNQQPTSPEAATRTPAASDAAKKHSAGLTSATGPLRNLLDETADLIESPTFIRIHSLLLDALFSHLIEHKVSHAAFPPGTPHQQQQQQQQQQQEEDQHQKQQPNPHYIPEVQSAITVIPATPTTNTTYDPATENPATTKLATILATLTRQAHSIANTTTTTTNTVSKIVSNNNNNGNGSNTSETNEYVEVMEREVRELDGFAAVIFSRDGSGLADGLSA